MSATSIRAGLWLPGLLVAAGAAVTTAHGLYEGPRAAGTPTAIAALYPLICDGLALVAYGATSRLYTPSGRAYAWTIVVLAAGLSGLAQAAHLAGSGVHEVPTWLRFGIGAWSATAAAIVAHLLYLLGASGNAYASSNPRYRRTTEVVQPVRPPYGSDTEPDAAVQAVHGDPSVPDSAADAPAGERALEAAVGHPYAPSNPRYRRTTEVVQPVRPPYGSDTEQSAAVQPVHGDPVALDPSATDAPAGRAETAALPYAPSNPPYSCTTEVVQPAQPAYGSDTEPDAAVQSVDGDQSVPDSSATDALAGCARAAAHPNTPSNPLDSRAAAVVQPVQPAYGSDTEPDAAVQPVHGDPAVPVSPATDAPARERARGAAVAHHDRHGDLPTVRELARLAGVARGTTGAVLKALRAQHDGPHRTPANLSPRTER